MLSKSKVVNVILVSLMILTLILSSYSQSIKFKRIASFGYILPVSPHPYGKLRIGNETLGQKPWFFYDENGRLVTLRMYQSGHQSIRFYTEAIPAGKYADGNTTWADASILFAKDAGFNCFRIHIFFGNKYVPPSEWLFPARRTVNEAVFEYFLDHLEKLANNNIYFVLDGYLHLASPNYWLAQEVNGSAPHYGGLLWNSTVKEDFIWVWNETLTRIKMRGENVWKHLVFIEPWSEWLLGGPGSPTGENIITNSQNPYRYNQSQWEDKGFGNASLVSWQRWLKKKYKNDIEKLKVIWGYGPETPQERWNASGREKNSFESLLMPTKPIKRSYNRALDFNLWFAETIENFTRDCNNYWKTFFPDLYVAWDGWQSTLGAGILEPDYIRVRTAAAFIYSDVLDGHDFASLSENYAYVFGDRYVYRQLQLATIARTLKKPYVTGEFGPCTGSSVGYDPAQDWRNIGTWNLTLNKALRYGYAGWCPYWVSYWHAFETGNINRILRADARQPYIRELNLIYKAAENWLDKIEYDPIMIVTPAGSHFNTYGSMSGAVFLAKLLDQAGYVPKYWGFSYNNETFYPKTIPDDVKVIILGELVNTQEYGKLELKIINEWLNSDSFHKLVVCHTPSRDFMLGDSIRWEDVLNVTLFPLSTVAYGVSYVSRFNNTDVYVNVDGVDVLLERSNNYHSGYYVEFVEQYITGTCLINYTDTGKPMTVINDRIAWIGSVISYQCGNPNANAYSTSKNGYLIIRKILSYWGYIPKIDVTQDYWRVGYGFSKISSTYGIISIFSLNHTHSGIIRPKLNFTRMGLDTNYSYVLFSLQTKIAMTKTPTELENGFSVQLGPLNREILILRKSDALSYLYSNSYLVYENITSELHLTCIFASTTRQTETIYFYFPYEISSLWKIEVINATHNIRLKAEDYYNNLTKIIAIPVQFVNWTRIRIFFT